MDAKISALEQEYAFLQKKREAMLPHMESIFNKIQELRKKRDMTEGKLTPAEETEFRRALTVVGELLERPETMFGGLRILDEEPEAMDGGYMHRDPKRKYSIHVNTGFVLDVCPGLRVNVEIKTKTPAIRAIIREMIVARGLPKEYDDTLKEKTTWEIDWEHYDGIDVVNPMTSSDYYKKDHRC